MTETQLIEIYDPMEDFRNVLTAASVIRNGGIAAIPTETVYGLAADAFNPSAVARVFEAKGRPADNPLIVHISDISQLEFIVSSVPESARALAEAFWPGPFTMILPKSPAIPAITSGGLDTVAVRMPSNKVAAAIISACETPLAAPSANRSGSPSPTTYEHCVADLWGRVDAIVKSHPCEVGLESTVVSLCCGKPRLLRPGAVTPAQIKAVAGDVEIDEGVMGMIDKDAVVLSPGMKYKHYSPQAKVTLVKGGSEEYAAYVNARRGDGVYAMCFDSERQLIEGESISYGRKECPQEQAQGLFGILRELDERGAKHIYVHSPDPEGIGLAVYNRLIRAAGFDVADASNKCF